VKKTMKFSPRTAVAISVLVLGAQTTSKAATGPCDLYGAGGNPCVAAHSTVRALFGAYSGALYQVRNTANATKDISVVAAGGAANGPAQDEFCTGTTCVITKIYDQSGKGNTLEYQGSGSTPGGNDYPSTATKETFQLNGNKVYSLWIDGTLTTPVGNATTNKPNSYWVNGSKSGIPTGSAPEAIYMVTSGTHVNTGCCFDYGNSETTRKADAAGAMDAIYFGTSCWFASSSACSGTGPWVQADIEWGLYPGGSSKWNPSQVSWKNKYVTAMLKNNGTTKMALKGGDATSGALTTMYEGSLPSGYNPMKKQGALVLGSGGDCCASNQNMSAGTFYEGAVVTGYPTDAVDNQVQSNIVSAGYGKTASVRNAVLKDGKAFFRYSPVNARATIGYSLDAPRNVNLDVTDLRGARVAVVTSGFQTAGNHNFVWDANKVPTGMYHVRLTVDGQLAWTEGVLIGR
jgi:hypothetical protein